MLQEIPCTNFLLCFFKGFLRCVFKTGLSEGYKYFKTDQLTFKVILPIYTPSCNTYEFPYIYFFFMDCTKAPNCVDHNKLWKMLKEMGIPDYLTCLLWNLYAGQEVTFRTRHGTTDWFQIVKGVYQGCILSPCLFNIYTEYIMWNAGMDESQAGIKIARRNTNKLGQADDTTQMTQSDCSHEIQNSWSSEGKLWWT